MLDTSASWNIPQGKVTLTENEVHVWRASLEVPSSTLSTLQQVLSPDEIKRAQRFRFEKDRHHWIVAHSVLRKLLGEYLGTVPTELQFSTNAYGKPSIASPSFGTRLHFNLAHSGTLALYAFCYHRHVGVDIEYMRSGIDYQAIAHSHFSSYENEQLQALPSELQEEAFFACWSRKEAYIKARGMGLSLPLDQFDVSLTPGEPAMLLASREDEEAVAQWSLSALSPGPHHAGALVVEGSGWHLSCWQW